MGFDVAEWFWFLVELGAGLGSLVKGKGLRFKGCQRGDDDGLSLVMVVLDGGTVGAAVLVVMELDGDSGSGNGGGLWVLVGESLGCGVWVTMQPAKDRRAKGPGRVYCGGTIGAA
ncbi:hypothetical protein GQ457_01G019010 [Hibiscus cannabinus]